MNINFLSINFTFNSNVVTPILVFAFGIIFTLIWFKINFHPLLKIALGFLLLGICAIIMQFNPINGTINQYYFYAALLAISETLISPILISALLPSINRNYLTLVCAALPAMGFISSFLYSNQLFHYLKVDQYLGIITSIVSIIFILLIITLYFKSRVSESLNNR